MVLLSWLSQVTRCRRRADGSNKWRSGPPASEAGGGAIRGVAADARSGEANSRTTVAAGEPAGQDLWRVPHGFSTRPGLLRAEETNAEEPASPALPTPRSAGRPAFVELPAAMLALPGECVLEFENAVGAKLRVHLKGATIPDLVALGRSLWNAGP